LNASSLLTLAQGFVANNIENDIIAYMKMTKDNRITTRKPWQCALVRFQASDISLWIAAAEKLGVSRSQFVRQAVRAEALKTLGGKEAR
jgi:hypothetical protein